jgi:hypothetical protein
MMLHIAAWYAKRACQKQFALQTHLYPQYVQYRMKISDAINKFLAKQTSPHAAHYHSGLELQIDPVDAATVERSGIGVYVFPIRIPKNGSTSPYDNDRDMPYPLEMVDRLGTSGWNWRKKTSEFVVFDFDSGQGHNAGLSDEELQEVQQAAANLPYVQVHRSKGGKGLHFYVFLEEVSDVLVRKDHRLVSLVVIAQMSRDADFDFSKRSDCEGVIAWLWSRDAASNGFALVKKATEKLTLSSDWRERGLAAQRKTSARRNGKQLDSMLADFTAAYDDVQLDDQHEAIIDWLCANGWVCVIEDYNGTPLLRTHTAGLKAAHQALKLRGVFETISTGTDPNKPNCFCFFRSSGRLVVRRYGSGCREAATWQPDDSNWTFCNFNEDPDFDTVCKAVGGSPAGRGDYRFDDHESAIEAIRLLGSDLIVPERLQGRPIFAKQCRGTVFLKMQDAKGDRDEDGPEWRLYRRNWEKVVEVEARKAEAPTCDHYVRRLINRTNKGICYVHRTDEGVWIDEEKDNCRLRLLAAGYEEEAAKIALGCAVARPWMLVNDPFGPEYRKGRIWNREGAQLAVEPAEHDGPFTTWISILEHCGQGLNDAVANNPWCMQHSVRNGADYLLLWIVSLFQRPRQRLPYLFFYSEDHEL